MDYITTENIESFFLVFVRVLSIVVFLPIIGYKGIPQKVKVMFSLIVAVLVFPSAKPISVMISGSVGLFATYTLSEVLIGIIIGFFAMFIFVGFQFAGELMGMQMGLTMMQMFDPTTETNISTMGRLIYVFLMLIFLIIGGHIFFIEAIGLSFNTIPLGIITTSGLTGILGIAITHSVRIFEIAIKAGAPVIVSLYIIEALLGVVARTAPQMNIFFVGIPLKIGVGLIIFITILGYSTDLFISEFGVLQSSIFDVIKLLGGG